MLAGIGPETALVSVQLANHEVGTVQPAAEVVAGARERGVLTHVDACAAAGHLPIDFAALGADLCSVTAHKLGGPRGSAPCSSAGACACRPFSSAAPRNEIGGRGSRTWPPPSASPPRPLRPPHFRRPPLRPPPADWAEAEAARASPTYC